MTKSRSATIGTRKAAKCRRSARGRALPPPDRDDDAPPANIDEFRWALVREIMALLGLHRRCRDTACRRARRCVGSTIRCQRDFPAPPMTPDDQARALAEFQEALKRHAESRS